MGLSSMFRRPGPALAALVVAAAMTVACGHQPDVATHPQPSSVSFAPLHHPFQDATLYVDRQTAAARWQATNRARWLDPITTRPQAHWLNSPQDLYAVPGIVAQARAQRALVVFVAYYLINRGCSKFKEGAPTSAGYEQWIDQLVHALSGARTVIVLEPDAVPAECFDAQRAALLRRTVRRLADAGQYVYLDAGHSRWRSSGEVAQRLLDSGIEYAEGFAVNVSNRQSTKDSYAWGREVSDLVGDREFIIDTSRNGLGPPPDEKGRDDEWCNPRQQALGDAPQPRSDRPGLAALLWIKAPGESDGICGGEHSYLFSPAQARNLIVNTTWLSARDRDLATTYRPPGA
jgi:endoglucanase